MSGCTESPFGASQIETGDDSFSGLVTLEGGVPAANAYVWLQGLNVATRADAEGKFELRLPNVGSFGAREDINGAFTVYFYIANYQFDARQVAARNGEFVYAQGDIDDDGVLIQPAKLDSFLNIATRVMPGEIDARERRMIVADVSLVTPIRGAADVRFPVSPAFPSGAVILRNTETGAVVPFATVSGEPMRGPQTIGHVAQHVPMEFIVEAGQLPAGTYEVIPHIIVLNDQLPGGLLPSLSSFFGFPDASYMKLPFARDEGYLVIKPE
jgi:hypothetical protein